MAIARSSNLSEGEKSTLLRKAIEHVELAQKERHYHKTISGECQESVRSHFRSNDAFVAPLLHARIPPNTVNVKVHSFDMAQQVQPGPMYFLTPRKCTISLVSAVKLSRIKCFTSLMKQRTLARVPIVLSVISTIYSSIILWENSMYSSMLTIVLGKISTMLCCSICHGES